MLAPVVALALWTHAIMVWMYIGRLPAMHAAKMKSDRMAPRGSQMATLPARVRWKSDNYTHLTEQPTVFYAVAIVLAVIGTGDGHALWLAWGYVGLRIVHSLVQTLWNWVELRFVLFALMSIDLLVLTLVAAQALR